MLPRSGDVVDSDPIGILKCSDDPQSSTDLNVLRLSEAHDSDRHSETRQQSSEGSSSRANLDGQSVFDLGVNRQVNLLRYLEGDSQTEPYGSVHDALVIAAGH